MKSNFTKIILLFVAIIFSNKSFAQWSTPLTQNVDAAQVPTLPTGFTSYPTAAVAFMSDSSNASDCAGASGLNNIVIKNQLSSTGDYILFFPSFATTGLDTVKISWNSRVSTHFLDLGSSINDFEFSTDGSNWTPLSFTDNAATSTWAAVNNGNPIYMPSAALNQSSVQLRLNIHIVNDSSGTYRMDDISVKGFDINGTGISLLNNSSSFSVYPNSVLNVFSVRTEHNGVLELFSSNGSRVMLMNCSAGTTEINSSEFSSGLYLLRFHDSTTGKISTEKLLRN